MTSPTPPITVVERRRTAAAALLNRLRESDRACLHIFQLTPEDAGPGGIVLWAVPGDRAWAGTLELARRAAERGLIVVIGDGLALDQQRDLLLAGVRGYIDQSEAWPAWLETLRGVEAGDCRFPAAVLSAGINALRRRAGGGPAGTDRAPRPDQLSAREVQVARRVALGESNADIAEGLFISLSTVKTHLQHIFEKLAVASRVELALLAASQPERFELTEQARAARVR